MSGISDSAKFNDESSYYQPANGNTVSGVSALNLKAGALSLASADNSVVVSSGGASIIDLSTTGTAQSVASLASAGAVSGASVVSSGTITATGAVTSGGILTQGPTATTPATGTGTVSGTWKITTERVAGLERVTYTLLNSPFVSNTVLNVPIVGNIASKISIFCVNNGNTQSRSIQALYSISVASGVYTQGPVYETNFNMLPTWIGSGGSSPLQYTVQLSGGGGGLVGTISIIAVQEYVVS